MTEAPPMNLADKLAKLENLRQSGALTDAEFAQAKAKVLGNTQAGPVQPEAAYDGERLAMPGSFLHKLERSRTDAWMGGVCGGLGRSTEIPSWAWRLMFAIAIFMGGIGLLPYSLMWIFIPLEPGEG